MREHSHTKTEPGFSLPDSYRISDSEATFRMALAVFASSTGVAAFLGAQIVGLI